MYARFTPNFPINFAIAVNEPIFTRTDTPTNAGDRLSKIINVPNDYRRSVGINQSSTISDPLTFEHIDACSPHAYRRIEPPKFSDPIPAGM